MRHSFRCLFSIWMFLLGLGIGRLHAQGVSTGRLHGNVQDQLGAAVSGADVVIRNELTGLVRNTVTDDEGYYQADRMPPGTYALGVSKEGFTTWERVHARLEAGQTLRIDPMLAVGAITSKVTVEATSVLVNTTSASFNNVIDTKRVLELPTLQRDLTSFFALNTGVTRPSGGGRTTVTLNGSPQTGSNFTIDGTDTTTLESQALRAEYAATPLVAASLDSVAEFKVTSGVLDASASRTSSAGVNLITKSGTNEYHGSLYEFYRGNWLNALNPFPKALGVGSPHFVTNQFGGTLGAPILKNRLFYFLSYEGQRIRNGSFARRVVPTAPWKRGLTDPFLAELFSRVPDPNDPIAGRDDIGFLSKNFSPQTGADLATGRIDWHIGPRDTLFVRANISTSRTHNPNLAEAFSSDARYLQQTFTAGHTRVFSPTLLNEFRFGVNESFNVSSNLNWTPVGGITTQDGGFSYSGIRITLPGPGRSYTVANDFSKRVGSHELKIGFELYWLDNLTQTTRVPPTYTFRTMTDLQQNRPFQASFVFGAEGLLFLPFDRTYSGFYVQDEYRPTKNLTLNLGVRYEYYTVDTVIESPPRNNIRDSIFGEFRNLGETIFDPDRNNFGPRFGFAWSPQGSARMVVRGGYGLMNAPGNNILRGAAGYISQYRTGVVSQADRPDLRYPLLNPFLSGVLGRFLLDPKLRDLYAQEWNLSVERAVWGDTTNLRASYVGTHAVHVPMRGLYNLPRPAQASPGNPSGRLDPAFSDILQDQFSQGQNYHALQIAVQRRFVRDLGFDVYYTWSHTIDTTGNIDSIAHGTTAYDFQDFTNLNRDRASSPVDFRHALVFDYVYEVPLTRWLGLNSRAATLLLGNWQINGITTLRSGAAVNIVTGRDNGSGQGRQRPNLVPGAPTQISGGSWVTGIYNAPAYSMPSAAEPITGYRNGNLGRNTERGPRLANWDISVIKRFVLREQHQLQFRVELFNAFNNVNYDAPVNALSSPFFGKSMSAAAARIIQLGGRYTF